MIKEIIYKKDTLETDLLPLFKAHLRILDAVEDETIKMYLGASIDTITHATGHDIKESEYRFTQKDTGERVQRGLFDRTYIDVSPITKITLQGATVPPDNIDYIQGYIYPRMTDGEVAIVNTGYATADDVPSVIKSLVFRYGAHLYENREAFNAGKINMSPDWVNLALSVLHKPRV